MPKFQEEMRVTGKQDWPSVDLPTWCIHFLRILGDLDAEELLLFLFKLKGWVWMREFSGDYRFFGGHSRRLILDDIEDWDWASNLSTVASDSEDLRWVLSVAWTLVFGLLDSKIFIKEPLIDLEPRQASGSHGFFAVFAVAFTFGFQEKSLKVSYLILRLPNSVHIAKSGLIGVEFPSLSQTFSWDRDCGLLVLIEEQSILRTCFSHLNDWDVLVWV